MMINAFPEPGVGFREARAGSAEVGFLRTDNCGAQFSVPGLHGST